MRSFPAKKARSPRSSTHRPSTVNLLKSDTTAAGKATALQSLGGEADVAGVTTNTPDTLTVENVDLYLGSATGTFKSLTATTDISTTAVAQTAVGVIKDAQTSRNTRLTDRGAASRTIDAQSTFTSKPSDVVEASIDNLVDADLAKESACL